MDGEGRSVPYRNSSYWHAGISSETASYSHGNANNVSLFIDNMITMRNLCGIDSSISGTGDAGNIIVKSQNMKIDGQAVIASNALAESEGNAGNVEIIVTGLIEMFNGAEISSGTYSKGDAGSIIIKTGEMQIDGLGNYAGIFSNALYNSQGNAGTIKITVGNRLELLSGAQISSSTKSEGDAGSVIINAGEIKIDELENSNYYTGIFNDTRLSESKGNAGKIEITATGLIELLNGATISSGTLSNGDAGSITIFADNLRIDGQGSKTGIVSNTLLAESKGKAGTIEITATGLIELLNGATISSNTESEGDAGNITISSGNLRINGQFNESGIFSNTILSFSKGKAGTIEITATGQIELLNGATISSATLSNGDAGGITIFADNLKIDGQGNYAGIISNSILTESEGKAGTIKITTAGLIELLNGAIISSNTDSGGDAGSIIINAGEININGLENSNYYTGIFNDTCLYGSKGNAGKIEINATGQIELLNGATISSSTLSNGDAGAITIFADNLIINGQGSKTGILSNTLLAESKGKAGTIEITATGVIELLNGARISSNTESGGDAGNVIIKAGEINIDDQGNSNYYTGIFSDSLLAESEGKAGTIKITTAGLIELLNGAEISSYTESKGDAGNISIAADNIKIDGYGQVYDTGIYSSAISGYESNAGTITITITGLIELLNGAQVSSHTSSKGNAGSVIVNAGRIKMDGLQSYITSAAAPDSSGKAGTVEITVTGMLELFDGAGIFSNTYSQGDAGNVIVNAHDVLIDGHGESPITGILSRAKPDSTGYVGNISVNADSITLLNNAEISIAAQHTNPLPEEKLTNLPTKNINLNVKRLYLSQGGQITSESTGNVSASNININAETIYLHDGLITTSVQGSNGDGGNICINEDAVPAYFLIMQNGFIQANTSAPGADGGQIKINADSLITDKSMRFQIGGEPENFQLNGNKNIIQAADDSKNPQDIQTPEVPLDLGGTIANMGAKFSEPVNMATNYCLSIGTKKASSLIECGKGGIPELPEEASSIFFDQSGLDELLFYQENL